MAEASTAGNRKLKALSPYSCKNDDFAQELLAGLEIMASTPNSISTISLLARIGRRGSGG